MTFHLDNFSKRNIALVSFLIGLLLMFLIVGLQRWHERGFENGPAAYWKNNQLAGVPGNFGNPEADLSRGGMMGGDFGRTGDVFDNFDRMERNMNRMQRRMWGDFDGNKFFEGRSNQFQIQNNNVVNEFSGKMSFALNDKQFELPYSVKDKALKLDLTSLKTYLQANSGQKILIDLNGPAGRVDNQFTKVEDFKSNELSYDYVQGARYDLLVQVLGNQGEVLMNLHQRF